MFAASDEIIIAALDSSLKEIESLKNKLHSIKDCVRKNGDDKEIETHM